LVSAVLSVSEVAVMLICGITIGGGKEWRKNRERIGYDLVFMFVIERFGATFNLAVYEFRAETGGERASGEW
jgi:hypothetical protein